MKRPRTPLLTRNTKLVTLAVIALSLLKTPTTLGKNSQEPSHLQEHDILDTDVSEFCAIDCQNGGTCLEGDAATSFQEDHRHPQPNGAELPLFHTKSVNGFYCKCRRGYTGVDCSIPYETCPNSESGQITQCFNGGVCLDSTMPTTSCDCSKALSTDGTIWAGQFCELKVRKEQFCGSVQDGRYCLNGGSCKTDFSRPDEGPCVCGKGYSGAHCEIPRETEESCTLPCENGGICKQGSKTESTTLFDVSNVNNMYCECPPGYDGVQCEYQVDVCGVGGNSTDSDKPSHICLHGSKCVADGNEPTGYTCSCGNDQGESNQANEGVCPYHTMEICSPSANSLNAVEYFEGMAVPAFCVNGGTCKDIVVGNSLHQGCDCPHLFHGPHCEHLKNGYDLRADLLLASVSKAIGDSGLRDAGFISLYILISMLAVLGLFFLARSVRRRRKKKKAMNNVNMNLHSFKDENFGARSANGNMLFPSTGPAASIARAPSSRTVHPPQSAFTKSPPASAFSKSKVVVKKEEMEEIYFL